MMLTKNIKSHFLGLLTKTPHTLCLAGTAENANLEVSIVNTVQTLLKSTSEIRYKTKTHILLLKWLTCSTPECWLFVLSASGEISCTSGAVEGSGNKILDIPEVE